MENRSKKDRPQSKNVGGSIESGEPHLLNHRITDFQRNLAFFLWQDMMELEWRFRVSGFRCQDRAGFAASHFFLFS